MKGNGAAADTAKGNDQSVERLFQGLIWPAVAGNVLWGFLTTALHAGGSDSQWPRAAILGLVAAYLGREWWRSQKFQYDSTVGLIVTETIFAVAFASMAIATQQDQGYVVLGACSALYVWGCVAHHWNLWPGPRLARSRGMMATHFVAVLSMVSLLYRGPDLNGPGFWWWLLGTMGAVMTVSLGTDRRHP